jgi:hypothetical protein
VAKNRRTMKSHSESIVGSIIAFSVLTRMVNPETPIRFVRVSKVFGVNAIHRSKIPLNTVAE